MRRWMALAAWAACAVALQAHDLGRSESAITVRGAEVRARLFVDLLELSGIDANGDGLVTYGELDAQIDPIFSLVKRHFAILASPEESLEAGQAREPREPARTILERYTIRDGHVGELDLLSTFDAAPAVLTVRSTLHEVLRPAVEHVTSVSVGDWRTGGVLDAAHLEATFVLPAARIAASRRIDAGADGRLGAGGSRIALLVGLGLVVALSVGSLVRTALGRRAS